MKSAILSRQKSSSSSAVSRSPGLGTTATITSSSPYSSDFTP
jgi:hypothetical protein